MTPFPTITSCSRLAGVSRICGRSGRRSLLFDGPRAQRSAQTNSRPYDPDPDRDPHLASDIGADWYGFAADICRVHAALQASAVGAAAPVKQILSAIPGIDLDRAKWTYIGAKGGNLPGDLTFSWYAVDRTGQP